MFGPKIYPQLPAMGNINQDSATRSRSNKMDESGHEIHRFTMIHQQKGGDSPSPSRRLNADHPRFARAAYKTEHGGSRAAQMPGIEADTSSYIIGPLKCLEMRI